MKKSRLSPAERLTLQALAESDSTKEAAALRGLSEQTVKNEMSQAYHKLGVRNRTAAFRKLGWLRPNFT